MHCNLCCGGRGGGSGGGIYIYKTLSIHALLTQHQPFNCIASSVYPFLLNKATALAAFSGGLVHRIITNLGTSVVIKSAICPSTSIGGGRGADGLLALKAHALTVHSRCAETSNM